MNEGNIFEEVQAILGADGMPDMPPDILPKVEGKRQAVL